MSDTPVWKLKFYGVRGSIPVCESTATEFGGNTTCFYLDLLIKPPEEKAIVIFDAGTGIRQLGKDILSGLIPRTEYILIHFSHFHWDHIQGFPFFAPAYSPDQKIALFSPHFHAEDWDKLKGIFAQQMQREYFPVQLDRMGANMRFYSSEEFQERLSLDKHVKFSYYLHNHPGGAYSYRIDGYGKSLVICTDIEHGETIDAELVEFCREVDVLVHDGQFTDEQLIERRGWGHSSFSQAIEVAKQANVKKLYITHHDPDHHDDFLRIVEKDCQAIFPNCFFAKEGIEVLI